MMTQAIDNERLAVRQVMAEYVAGNSSRLQDHWDKHWEARAKLLDGTPRTGSRRKPAFAAMGPRRAGDSVIVPR